MAWQSKQPVIAQFFLLEKLWQSKIPSLRAERSGAWQSGILYFLDCLGFKTPDCHDFVLTKQNLPPEVDRRNDEDKNFQFTIRQLVDCDLKISLAMAVF